jgi:2-polyprenyl-6-methoxyphenol hydroxylase-like FAD-dependent oxidoreductase
LSSQSPSILDVAICGCGPAGLAAALLLHRAGHRVRIFERFETPRPVGSGLIVQPTGLGVLVELGLIDDVLALGARIDRLFGRVMPSNRVVLDVRYAALGPGWHGVALQRAALFALLHRAAIRAGIEIEPGVEVTAVERSGGQTIPKDVNGRRLGAFDLVVDALGARSPLAAVRVKRRVLPYGALWANIPWPSPGSFNANALEQRYLRASRMAGLLPIGSTEVGAPRLAAFFWSLRRDQFPAWRARPIADWKRNIEQLWPEAAAAVTGITDHEQLVFAQYDHFTVGTPYSEGLVHIGDAGRSTSPQLGQGANMALLDALALARALQAEGGLSERLRHYKRLRFWHVRLFQAASAMFTPFYQSDSRLLPFVRDWLAAPVSRLPIGDMILARLVAGMTVAPLGSAPFEAWRELLPGPRR